MADAIVSSLVESLTSMVAQEMNEEVRLVMGVDKEVTKLTNNLRAIKAVLVVAERRQWKEEAVKVWLDQLKDASYSMEDVLDEWNTARLKLQIEGTENAVVPQKKVCSFFSSPCFRFTQVSLRRGIALKIKEINENLDDIDRVKNNLNFNLSLIRNVDEKSERIPSISLIDESEIYGRDDDNNTLISKLLHESSKEEKTLHVISIVGMGGMGKTTLAQLAWNNNKVKENFEKMMCVCVSQIFDELRIARAIFEQLGASASNLNEFQSIIMDIKSSVDGKKFFLVLDDVWTEDYSKWEPFYHCLSSGLRGSKILITTRKESVAHMMRSIEVIPMKELTNDKCWLLFRRFAFFDRSMEECEKLEKIGQEIAGKCKGLPLAAKTLGSLLYSKNTEEEWNHILGCDLWEVEELENSLFAPLLLSYNDLPSMVKHCFSYCAIFPKDYRISKNELIKLWMAQGYLNVKKNKEMEIIGEEYFHILATRSFFQEFEKDDAENILNCKMHEIVHDFARFLRKSECFSVEVPNALKEALINSFHKKVCHSMLMFGEESSFPVSICRLERLRSLIIRGDNIDYWSINKVLAELFHKLTCLRALDLRASALWWSNNKCIKEIPTNIEKMVHLRYLNLFGQKMKKLPETLCELYNLQILDVSGCVDLEELPQGIGTLTNMRYLLNEYTYSLLLMPVGISRLTNLRRLTKFTHDSHGCTLESLKNIKLLQECGLGRLGDVSDIGEANRLELDKKTNLLVLVLSFDTDREGERKNEEDVQLLESLKPPVNLKELEVQKYRGNTIFPNWMMSLTNMRSLKLYWCKNCKHLPPLGKLPSLEKLVIAEMLSLRKMGNEFLGIESNHDLSSSSSIISFPKLKHLEICGMDELEEWDYGAASMGEIMPLLFSLKISYCHKLKALPDQLLQITTLQSLRSRVCPILRERYRKGIGEDWPKISHIPNTVVD